KLGRGGFFGGDFEVNPGIGQSEVDHAAGCQEILRLTDRKDAQTFERRQNGTRPIALRRAHKEDVTVVRLPRIGNKTHYDAPSKNGLPANGFAQRCAERSLTQDADPYRICCVLKRRRRPLHEFREIDHERRFDLVLTQGGFLTLNWRYAKY